MEKAIEKIDGDGRLRLSLLVRDQNFVALNKIITTAVIQNYLKPIQAVYDQMRAQGTKWELDDEQHLSLALIFAGPRVMDALLRWHYEEHPNVANHELKVTDVRILRQRISPANLHRPELEKYFYKLSERIPALFFYCFHKLRTEGPKAVTVAADAARAAEKQLAESRAAMDAEYRRHLAKEKQEDEEKAEVAYKLLADEGEKKAVEQESVKRGDTSDEEGKGEKKAVEQESVKEGDDADESDADEGDEDSSVGDADEGDKQTIESHIEALSKVLLKWVDAIPVQCGSDFARAIKDLCEYVDNNIPTCPVCGKSAAEIDLRTDEVALTHDC